MLHRQSDTRHRRGASPRWVLSSLLAAGAWLLFCGPSPEDTATKSTVAEGPSTRLSSHLPLSADRYPRGRWRLADPTGLNTVPIWLSHILVRYEKAYPFVPFHDGWLLPHAVARTHREAQILAEQIYERASADPERFGALAREFSEDVASAEMGGSWGGVAADALLRDSPILDALAAMRAGEVSHPVPSRYGFHVLLRRSPPPFEVVDAKRVVIPYDEGPSCGAVATSEECPHPRSEARAEAENVCAQLRGAGSGLDSLSARYRVEEIGIWTTWDSGEYSREREVLGRMKIGEVSDPIDSEKGYEILQRIQVDPKPEYDVEVLRLRFSDRLPAEHAYSRASVRRVAESIESEIVRAPGRFDKFRQQYCCSGTRIWRVGREPSELTDAVAAVRDGATARLVEYDSTFIIARRISWAPAPQAEPPTELPQPSTTDVMLTAKMLGGDGFQSVLRRVGNDSAAALDLDSDAAADIKWRHEILAAAFDASQSPSSREEALRSFRTDMEGRLSALQFASYWALLTDRVSNKLMSLK